MMTDSDKRFSTIAAIESLNVGVYVDEQNIAMHRPQDISKGCDQLIDSFIEGVGALGRMMYWAGQANDYSGVDYRDDTQQIGMMLHDHANVMSRVSILKSKLHKQSSAQE